MKHHTTWIICLNVLLCGCNIGPKYTVPPSPQIPCEWHSQLSEGMQMDLPENFIWWEAFDDPMLNSLIERMASQNLDLYLAASRILEAREMRSAGTAPLYPHIDGTAAYGGLGYNKKILNKILDIDHCNSSSGQKNLSFFEIGFDAEWELDIFGVHRHELTALKAKLEASKEDFRHIWISLSAEVARNYIELRGLQQRLELLTKDIADQTEALSLINSLDQTGFKSGIQQNQAQTDLNLLQAQKTQLELSIQKTIHRLSVLLGLPPGELYCELNDLACLPALPCERPIGIPSELLMRRSDIRKAEREIAAANAQVASAVAAQFPRLSLRGFIGDLSAGGTNSFTWFASPQLLAPLFNSKALEQSVKLNKIKMEQTIYEYQKTVLTAFEETENALSAFHYELERNAHLAQAEALSKSSFELTQQLYETGSKDSLDARAAKRAYLSAQDAFLQSRIELLLHYIAIYKALGGSWSLNDCKF